MTLADPPQYGIFPNGFFFLNSSLSHLNIFLTIIEHKFQMSDDRTISYVCAVSYKFQASQQ